MPACRQAGADADRQVNDGRYNLRRSFGASVNYLLIKYA